MSVKGGLGLESLLEKIFLPDKKKKEKSKERNYFLPAFDCFM